MSGDPPPAVDPIPCLRSTLRVGDNRTPEYVLLCVRPLGHLGTHMAFGVNGLRFGWANDD